MRWIKWILITAGIIIVVATVIVVVILLVKPEWIPFSEVPGYGDSGLSSEDEYEGTRVLYSQKYEEAVDMLHDKDLEEVSAYLVVVDVSEQREYVFTGDGGFIDMYKISTGADAVFVGNQEDEEEGEENTEFENRSMGPSVWKVVSKRESGLASLYGDRLMMLDRLISGNWVRTEVALHGTNAPEILGTPASLGCVYHNNVDIIALYDLIDIGTYVVAIE